ncbi:hypothetical protein KC19_1G278000 [Ceratodon purpureus]|uniref:Uncharacterized protein n=1 Tax=Ceratodon purpureus TaxID=3225 RepID=A0A8T0JA10_CERPU|nr:hypothetical protein KC19_1G278000 [Ceratodon purpureus]
MEVLVNASDGWQEQLVQLNKIYACLATANELERTGVGVADSKRSRLRDHVDDSLGEHLGVRKPVSSGVLHGILQNGSNLVSLMEAENEFVRHSVKKILVALSDHLILKSQMSSWCSLLHHIWNVITLESGKGLMVEKDHNRDEGVPTCHPPSLLVKCEVNDSLHLERKWGPVVCGLEVLRCILKSCINEDATSDEHTEVFLRLLEEKIHTIVKITCPEACNPGDSLCSERGLVWSALLQLMCTTIACCDGDPEDSTSASSELQLLLVEKIGGCIPLFARVALSPHKHSSSLHCPSSFLRHKVLRLMIGLSRWFETQHSLGLQCLRALRKEGADLLGFSLVEDCAFSNDNNLMRSSFLRSFVHTKEEVGEFAPHSATHLQCRAVFLLFRIWSLVATELDPKQVVRLEAVQLNNPEDRKELEDRAPQFTAGIHQHGQNCLRTSCRCRNLSEMALNEEANAAVQEWLQLQSDVVSVDKLKHFPMILVGLYLDEDDLMIEMLLLLVKLRSPLLVSLDKNLKKTLAFANALSPLELFQALLQALSYDHTVLVDFLISQNTGTLFLQYLMLCTGLFTKPEFYSKMEHSSSCETASGSLSKESLDCLLQLKAAIERLHRRKLFPYNPTPLLKRLGMLEELHHRI